MNWGRVSSLVHVSSIGLGQGVESKFSFRVEGSKFRVQGVGFKFGFTVEGLGCRVQVWVYGSGFRA